MRLSATCARLREPSPACAVVRRGVVLMHGTRSFERVRTRVLVSTYAPTPMPRIHVTHTSLAYSPVALRLRRLGAECACTPPLGVAVAVAVALAPLRPSSACLCLCLRMSRYHVARSPLLLPYSLHGCACRSPPVSTFHASRGPTACLCVVVGCCCWYHAIRMLFYDW